MNEAAVRQCRWREPGGIDAALQIAAFLDGIGIELEAARVDESFRENFAANRTLGVPMLAWYGMTAEVHRAKERGIPAFPAMTRWLR